MWDSHGLVISVVNNCAFMAALALLLELEVLLKDTGETVAFEQSGFLHHRLVVGRNVVQIEQQRHIVSCVVESITTHNMFGLCNPSQ